MSASRATSLDCAAVDILFSKFQGYWFIKSKGKNAAGFSWVLVRKGAADSLGNRNEPHPFPSLSRVQNTRLERQGQGHQDPQTTVLPGPTALPQGPACRSAAPHLSTLHPLSVQLSGQAPRVGVLV